MIFQLFNRIMILIMLYYKTYALQIFCLLLCFHLGKQAQCQSLKIHTLKFQNVAETMDYFHYSGDGFIIISGHRGGAMKGYPENCIASFEHTLSATPAIFETDPRLTRDSGAVLIHDDTLSRVSTGRGKVNKYSLEQLSKLRLKDPQGNSTPYRLSALEEAIQWAKGKTIINLDVKDVPLKMKARLVKKYNAYPYVIFTIHNAAEAAFFYNYDHRSLFSAWIRTADAFEAYEKTGIPWSNFLMAYIGPEVTDQNKALIQQLHQKGVMVMIGAGPSIDKLSDSAQRAAAYRQLIAGGIDIIESDRPIEVASAIHSLYPTKSEKYKYWSTSMVNNKNKLDGKSSTD